MNIAFAGQDFDFIRGLKLDFHWDISDPESGLETCSWALGRYCNAVTCINIISFRCSCELISFQFSV